MPASIRIIKIVKDPMTHEEAYTIEFEAEVESSEDLIGELMKSELGRRAIELLNQADFMPEPQIKSAEELKAEAEAEAERIKKREEKLREEGRRQAMAEYGGKSAEELKEEGRKEVRKKYLEFLRKKRGVKE